MPAVARSSLLIAAAVLAASPTLAADPSLGADPARVVEVAVPVQPASGMDLADASVVSVEDGRIIAVSPDGRSIAITRPTADASEGELCVLALATLDDIACADLAPLQAGLRPDDVAWSPDGRFLAFTERALELFVDGDLWLMDTSSGRLTNLLDDGFEGPLPIMQREPSAAAITIPANPAFSPDGTTLAFSRSLLVEGAMAGNDVVALPLDGGDPQQLWVVDPRLIGVAYLGMAWAPSGDELYVSVSSPGGREDRDGIWVVDPTTGEGRQLVGRYQPGGSAPALLAVAPDGRHLLAYDAALWGRPTDGMPALALVETRTGAVTPLLSSGGPDTQTRPIRWASFSPDGSTLATLASTVDAGWLSVRDAGGTREYPLTLPAEPARLAASGPAAYRAAGTWSRDGWLLLALATDPASALLLEVEGSSMPAADPAVE